MNQHEQDLQIIEKLRADVERLESLESLEQQIQALKDERKEMINSTSLLSHKLEEYRQGMEEWEWFFDHSLEGLCIASLDGYFKRVNPAFAKMLGYKAQELMATPFSDFVHPDDKHKTSDELNALGDGIDSINFENRYRNKQGEWRWLSWHCPGIGQQKTKIYAIARDVTESKQTQADIIYKATHDPLTQLFNRAAFEEHLTEAMARAKRNSNIKVVMYMIDLDGFKTINDTYGHQAGDQVLRVLAERLQENLRQGELVCRLGGDEFAILIEGDDDLQITPLAERILTATLLPITHLQQQLVVGCSIGISIYPQALDAHQLIAQADKAMYSIKKTGKCGFSLYQSQMG